MLSPHSKIAALLLTGALLPASSSAPAADSISARFTFQPEAEGRRQIQISKADEPLTWRLRIPERMFCDETMLVGHDIREVYKPVEWNREADIWVYRRTNHMDTPRGSHAFPNLGRTTLHNVVGHICLGHQSDPFRDPGHERTFIRSQGKFLNLKDTGRGPDPVRARYGVKGNRPIKFFDTTRNPFWGARSPQVADNGLVLTRSKSGDRLVAFWFDPASEIFQNSDEQNMCIHSDPAFGDLAPGESASVKGRIILFRGDLSAFEERYAAIPPTVDSAP
jgi:hypothetical protein